MNIEIIQANMTHDPEEGYVGQVQFRMGENSPEYEITLHSKKGKEWMYGLHFVNEPGGEEEILAVEELLEEDDEIFDHLVEAAKNKLQS